jgi:hypothetical protein
MLGKWKKYQSCDGTMRWPDRTQVVFLIGGFFGAVTLSAFLGITGDELRWLVIGAVAVFAWVVISGRAAG